MKINELDLSHVVGDFGSAALKQAGNRIMGKPEGQMSVKDKMAHDMFIRDFVGRAKADLNAAIKSGLVDAGSSTPPAQQATTPPAQQATTPPAQQPSIAGTAMPTKPFQVPGVGINPNQAKTRPAQPSPEAIRKQKQAVAAQAAQQQMAPFSKVEPYPQVWKNNRNPQATAQRSPSAPMKEDAAAQKMSIAQYIQNMFAKYMKKTNIKSPQVQQQLASLAKEVQSTYSSGAKEALTKLANLAYSVSYADINGDGIPDNAVPQKTSALDAMSAGFKKGLAEPQPSTAPDTASAPTSATQPTSYKQAVDLVKTLDKKGRQRILSYIEKKLGTVPAKPENPPSAMSNMARQLSTMGQQNTSTGGTQVPTGAGVKHTASPTNPNQAPKIDTMRKRAKAIRNRKKTVPASS